MTSGDFKATELMVEATELLGYAEGFRDETAGGRFLDIMPQRKERLLLVLAELRADCEEHLDEKTSVLDDFHTEFSREEPEHSPSGPYFKASKEVLAEEVQRTRAAIQKLDEIVQRVNDIEE